MAFWGAITAAASSGLSATATQQAVTAEAERLGVRTSFGTRQEIGRLFSQAVALRESSRELARANPTDTITSRMIAPLPYGGGLIGRAGPRVFDVRVNYTAVRNGESIADYVTLRYAGDLPATAGQLLEEAGIITSDLTESYGTSLSAIESVQIGEL